MKKLIFICLAIVTVLSSCSDNTTINQNEAGKVITNYLERNPEYKTTSFKFGELKFNSNKERDVLNLYKNLAQEGYVDMILVSQKKQFLSSDSSYVYQVKLTDKAQEFVLKIENDKANVKAVNYVLSEKPVNFEQVNSKTSKVTVTLKKENTPFGPFQKDKNEFSDYITKTYKLKLDKEEGWKVDN